MLLAALLRGDRPSPVQWLGLVSAIGGLVYLVLPGVTAPSPRGALLMLLAGVAWGIYSLRGRAANDPLGQTASNFARTVPMALAVSLMARHASHLEPSGFGYAIASGAIASGLGYVLWYQALAGLSRVVASIVQLAVPILAAGGGVIFLGERVTLRLGVAGLLVLGGIGLALLAHAASPGPSAVVAEQR